jgi:hypothetical protein
VSQTSVTLTIEELQLLRTLLKAERDGQARPNMDRTRLAARADGYGVTHFIPQTDSAVKYEAALNRYKLVTNTIGKLGIARDRAMARAKSERIRT